MKQRLTRAFVVAWLVLGFAGALNHTILDGRLNLALPHLQYGYVMFNRTPTLVPVFTYARKDGVRHDLAELDPRPAPGYARARASVDATLTPLYLRDLCNRGLTSADDEITSYIDGFDVTRDNETPIKSSTVTCNAKRR